MSTTTTPDALTSGLRSVRIVFGALALLLGIAVLAWPGATLLVVAVLIGIELVVAGIARIVLGTRLAGTPRTVSIVLGVLVLGPHLARWAGEAVGNTSLVDWVWWIAAWPLLVVGLLAAFAGIAVTSVLFAPLGARLATGLSPRTLKRAFAIFLALIGLKLFLG